MIPIGWNPRRYPPFKFEFEKDTTIWYLFDGSTYIPHNKDVVLAWDSEYLKEVEGGIYSAAERRRAYCSQYLKIAKTFAKTDPKILEG